MNILIIEDDAQKASTVSNFVTSFDRSTQIDIDVASSLSDGVKAVSERDFGLIVLDLMLPYIPGGSPSGTAGLEILRQIRSAGSRNQSTAVVGLSAFPEEVESRKSQFEEHGVLIVKYDDEGSWKSSIESQLRVATSQRDDRRKLDFLVFVALQEELEGFRHTGWSFSSKGIVSGLDVQYVKDNLGRPGAIVKLRGMGLVAATLDVAIGLNAFSTKIVCMSGICAGFSDNASLGQVVVPSPAWEYQAGKWSEGDFEISPLQIQLRPITKVKIEQLFQRDNILNVLERNFDRRWKRPSQISIPTIAPATTGSAVVADSSRLQHIEKQHRKVAALDMESYGLYFACHEIHLHVEHFFSAKAIVDLADADKGDDLHSYGCAVSARCVEAIVETLLA